VGKLGLFTGRKGFAQCYEDNGCWGKVFGNDAPKLWCWCGQREQQATVRGRARSCINKDIDRERGQRRYSQDILMHVRSPLRSKEMSLWGAVKLMLSTLANSLSPHGFGILIRRLLKEVTPHM
jgi:hypothetical protein